MSATTDAEGSAGGRQAKLRLTRIDPWSVAKVTFLFSVGIALAIVVAVGLLWLLFNQTGVFDSVGRTATEVFGSGVDSQSLFGFGQVMTLAAAVAIVQVILWTALSALLAALYNLAAHFVGGWQMDVVQD